MSKIYYTLKKYLSEHNIFDTTEFLKDNNVSSLNFLHIKTIPLKFYDTLQNNQYGGITQNIHSKIDGNKFIVKIDEYSDEDRLNIDFVTIDSVPNNVGDFNPSDNCGLLIIDKSNNSGTIQGLANYTQCVKPIYTKQDYKMGDVLTKIMIILAKKHELQFLNLTDNSYIQCNEIKIPLIHLRTMTKGEPYYCKHGFEPNTKEKKIYLHNKKIFLSKPKITLDEFKKILLFRNFDSKDKYDKKIISYINNKLLPRFTQTNLLSDIVNSMIDDKSYESCYLLYNIYESLYTKYNYQKYIKKSFNLVLN